jgi:hypothetical protein
MGSSGERPTSNSNSSSRDLNKSRINRQLAHHQRKLCGCRFSAGLSAHPMRRFRGPRGRQLEVRLFVFPDTWPKGCCDNLAGTDRGKWEGVPFTWPKVHRLIQLRHRCPESPANYDSRFQPLSRGGGRRAVGGRRWWRGEGEWEERRRRTRKALTFPRRFYGQPVSQCQ